MMAKFTKLQAVTSFVMACVQETLAGDWLDLYNAGTEQEADFVQFVPDGDVEAFNFDGNKFEIDFGGDRYVVKVTKVRQ